MVGVPIGDQYRLAQTTFILTGQSTMTKTQYPTIPRKHRRPIDIHWISLGYHTFKRWPINVHRILCVSGATVILSILDFILVITRKGKFLRVRQHALHFIPCVMLSPDAYTIPFQCSPVPAGNLSNAFTTSK